MANAKQTPWAVLACKFKSDQFVPVGFDLVRRFFTVSDSSFNAVKFFHEMSHGNVDLSGSEVFGWFTIDVAKTAGPVVFTRLARKAALKAEVRLDKFFGDVVLFNNA